MSFGPTNEVREQIFKYLVENGANLSCASGGTVFRDLLRGGHTELADWLMKKREIDVNECGYEGKTPLMLVVSLASDEVLQTTVNWLLDHGADVSAKDDLGKTAFDYAMEKGRVEIAELLR
jgi:ankyrin repeat protein